MTVVVGCDFFRVTQVNGNTYFIAAKSFEDALEIANETFNSKVQKIEEIDEFIFVDKEYINALHKEEK